MKKFGTDMYIIETNAQCALLSGNRMLLIDTGEEADASLLRKELNECGYKFSDIETVVITHTHPDHVGGLAAIKEQAESARVASHHLEAKYISREVTYDGPPGVQNHKGTLVDDKLDDAQVYKGLLVIHTPGHTPGNIALLDQETGVLIAGDTFRLEDEKIYPMDDKFNLNPAQHRESIKKLANYPIKKIIAGHGGSLSTNVNEKIKEAIANL